jgi:hypothetical protein
MKSSLTEVRPAPRSRADGATLAIFGPLSLEGAAIAIREAQAALRSRGFTPQVAASGTGVGWSGKPAIDESSRAILVGWNRALANVLNDFGCALETAFTVSGLLSRAPDATAKTDSAAKN